MKKILISIFFLCAASGNLFAQDTIFRYYDNNWVETANKNYAVFYRKAFQDSDKAWKVQDYYMSNKIQMTGFYKSKKINVRHGHFIYYFEKGNKSSEGNFINDKLDGLWTSWSENGQKVSEAVYNDGLQEGLGKYWYETGEKLSEGCFLKGQKVGVWNYYYENSQLKSTETYQKAEYCAYEGFYSNGVMNVKGNTAGGKPQGMWVYWNSGGRKILQGNFNYGIRDGEWTRFFPEGELKLHFKYGIPEDNQRGGIIRNE